MSSAGGQHHAGIVAVHTLGPKGGVQVTQDREAIHHIPVGSAQRGAELLVQRKETAHAARSSGVCLGGRRRVLVLRAPEAEANHAQAIFEGAKTLHALRCGGRQLRVVLAYDLGSRLPLLRHAVGGVGREYCRLCATRGDHIRHVSTRQ